MPTSTVPTTATPDDLIFHSSSLPTLGVELELQILDRDSGDLAPGGLRILQACKEDGMEGVSGEFHLSTIEVKSDVCQNVSAVRDNLWPRLWKVRNIASSLGFDLAFGGTHPFARPSMSAIFPDERYQRLQKRLGWMAYQEAIFGLHIHVGVPDGDAAIGVINQLVEYLPHLLSLSANSPFWQGIDTDYVSARLRMFKPSAGAGLPPHFKNWDAFRHFYDVMYQAGNLESTKDLHWDIRPSPKFGTVEFRIFDVPSTLSAVLGLCTLTRSLVINTLRELKQQPGLVQGDEQIFWLAEENKWLATRYGLNAECVRRPGLERNTLANDATQLIEHLRPIAEESGEADLLKSMEPANLESGADRQRRLYRASGEWSAVLDDMKHRWLRELEESLPTVKGGSSSS